MSPIAESRGLFSMADIIASAPPTSTSSSSDNLKRPYAEAPAASADDVTGAATAVPTAPGAPAAKRRRPVSARTAHVVCVLLSHVSFLWGLSFKYERMHETNELHARRRTPRTRQPARIACR